MLKWIISDDGQLNDIIQRKRFIMDRDIVRSPTALNYCLLEKEVKLNKIRMHCTIHAWDSLLAVIAAARRKRPQWICSICSIYFYNNQLGLRCDSCLKWFDNNCSLWSCVKIEEHWYCKVCVENASKHASTFTNALKC